MKHILVVITSFRHGGINKSLENMLSFIDIDKYSIDVFAMEHYGPYMTMLPNCKILKKNKLIESLISNWSDTKGLTKLRSFSIKIFRNFCKYIHIDVTDIIFKTVTKQISKSKMYDIAIAYSEGVPTRFVSFLENCNKAAWIHCDYSSYLKLNKQPDEVLVYNSFNSIVCVSEYTKKIFCNIMPFVESQVYSIHNILNTSLIFEQSKKQNIDFRFKKSSFNIVSIGRNDSIKRVYVIPEIVRTLVDRGVDFKWYLIGPIGSQQFHTELLNNIRKYNVEDYFIWLGAKDNPYPYITNSDLLVNVSVSESFSYVINEAKVLHIPIVCTDFGVATEIIENDINGFIVPIENIADKIENLIENKEEYNKIKENISRFTYDNEKILCDIYSLL